MNKKLRVFTLVFTLAALISSQVLAAPTSTEIISQRVQLQADENEFRKAQNKRFEIEQKIEDFDNQIEEVMAEIEGNQIQIKKIQEENTITEEELKLAEEALIKEQDMFNERMRVTYILGTDGYLNILLDSHGFSDFLSRMAAVKSIIDLDKEVISNIGLRQEELNKKKVELEQQNAKLSVSNIEYNKKLDILKLNKEKQNELIKEAESQEMLLASAVDDSQYKLNEVIEPNYTPSRGAVPVSSNAVVAFASIFLGTPYKWGGTTPAGFDCSGFTQYIYRHFGIIIGRTAHTQINDGYYVPRNHLKPGDLVFYGSDGSPRHVGIYVGNGMYIHSPRTGDVIKIASYDRSDYITARRVMG